MKQTLATMVLIGWAATGLAARFDPRTGPNLGRGSGDGEFTFAVLGDNRPWADAADPIEQNDYFKTNIGLVNASGADFCVNSGDLIRGYADHDVIMKEWPAYDRACRAYKVPYVNVVGNHDVSNEDMQKIWLDRYGPLYFSWNHQGCHFIALATEVVGQSPKITGDQLAWLAKDLEVARNARRIFVFMHQPVWAYRPEAGQTDNQWMRDVHPLLVKAGVDTVFAGHWHQYTWFPPRDGVRYVVTGGGGAEPDEIAGFFHVCRVHVKGRTSTLQVVTTVGTFPPEVVTWDQVRILQARAVSPLGTPGPNGRVPVAFTVTNPFPTPLAATFELDGRGTGWQSGSLAITIGPGGTGTLLLDTATDGRLFPLPQVGYTLMLDRLRVGQETFYPTVPLAASSAPRCIDDFEHDGVQNRCAQYGIVGAREGRWWNGVDKNGVSTINDFAIEPVADGVGGSKRASHLHGTLGVSAPGRETFAISFTGMTGDWDVVDLRPATGITFLVKSPTASELGLRVEGVVEGKWVTGGNGFDRRHLVTGPSWRRYTLPWSVFRQTDQAAADLRCRGPLSVDKVMSFTFEVYGDGKAFDVWLDDVALVFDQPATASTVGRLALSR